MRLILPDYLSCMNDLTDQSSGADTTPSQTDADRAAFEKLLSGRENIETELGKVIVGQRDVVEQILMALIFAPSFQLIQFTPDLMPSDITGTEILQSSDAGVRRMAFVPGPVFANIILADE